MMRFSEVPKLFVALAILPAAAHAKPRWQNVYTAAGLTVTVDSSSVARNSDGSYTLSTRWDYAKSRILENKQSYSRLVEKVRLKCDPVTVKRVATTLYNRAGKVMVEPDEVSDADLQIMTWDPPRKGSDGEKVFPAVCRHLGKMKPKRG